MKKPISFLSGPVMISPKVSKAFAQAAISHRSSEFSELVSEILQSQDSTYFYK
jgi:aspartate aminotransferase-like enzyme